MSGNGGEIQEEEEEEESEEAAAISHDSLSLWFHLWLFVLELEENSMHEIKSLVEKIIIKN